jgi:PTH1 family peptidyl-tRNA hydrolase
MKFLIVGLGNSGAEYERTRHNIGFLVVDQMAAGKAASFQTERYAAVCEIKHKGKTFVLIKPSTFMNLSGNALRYWMQHEKIPLENVLVITDDLALPFGKLRLRGKGSDGGHNGLKHIQATIQTEAYARLRFGVGSEFSKGQQVDYVLGEWNEEERKTLTERIDKAVSACYSFALVGLARSMNEVNTKE